MSHMRHYLYYKIDIIRKKLTNLLSEC